VHWYGPPVLVAEQFGLVGSRFAGVATSSGAQLPPFQLTETGLTAALSDDEKVIWLAVSHDSLPKETETVCPGDKVPLDGVNMLPLLPPLADQLTLPCETAVSPRITVQL